MIREGLPGGGDIGAESLKDPQEFAWKGNEMGTFWYLFMNLQACWVLQGSLGTCVSPHRAENIPGLADVW